MVDVVVTATDAAGNRAQAMVNIAVRSANVVRLDVADDGTDQTQAIVDQIAAVPDGTAANPMTLVLPALRARVDGSVRLDGRQHVHLIAEGAGFTAWTDKASSDLGVASRPHYDMLRSVGCGWRNLRVEGPNTLRQNAEARTVDAYPLYIERLEGDHAFAFRSGNRDCWAEAISYDDVYGDGLYIGFQNEGVANEGIRVRGFTGMHAGRQTLGITHVVDGEVADFDCRWGARSGMDIEPNHADDKVWDFAMRRGWIDSKFYPYVIGGADNGALPQRRNVTLEDAGCRYCPSNHAAVMANRGPTTGQLRIVRHRDERQSSIYGIIATAWQDVHIEASRVTTSRNTPTSYAVLLGGGVATIIGNDFTGKPGTEGFDELYAPTDTVVTAYGNRWAMGARSD